MAQGSIALLDFHRTAVVQVGALKAKPIKQHQRLEP